ncbi:hypothetical protein TNCV_2226441 [Trichonephila clavipes]|nr:hypothetical protein TNCV_2226441 [Trichonephila clavipes]
MFAASWTLSSEIMAAATLDAASLTESRWSHPRIWRHHGKRTLTACLRHCHTGISPCVMVWGAFGARLGHLLFALTAL